MLPNLLAPDATVGAMTAAAAAALGLPVGIPVGTGSGDNMMSALGAGVCVEARGLLRTTTGTSSEHDLTLV